MHVHCVCVYWNERMSFESNSKKIHFFCSSRKQQQKNSKHKKDAARYIKWMVFRSPQSNLCYKRVSFVRRTRSSICVILYLINATKWNKFEKKSYHFPESNRNRFLSLCVCTCDSVCVQRLLPCCFRFASFLGLISFGCCRRCRHRCRFRFNFSISSLSIFASSTGEWMKL